MQIICSSRDTFDRVVLCLLSQKSEKIHIRKRSYRTLTIEANVSKKFVSKMWASFEATDKMITTAMTMTLPKEISPEMA